MSSMIDLAGRRFGNLVVQARTESVNGRAAWNCKCDCGNTVNAIGQHLRRGVITGCGCVKIARAQQIGKANRAHGKTNSPEFGTWTAMLSRCTNERDPRFKRYGGRGIKVCDRWLESFENFLADVGNVPFPGAELDRENNDGNYEPGNCRWVTSKENNNNRSSCRYITHEGRRRTLTQWAEATGINPATLRQRLESGWSIERSLTQPVRAWGPV